jgi:hypothetical protein
MAEAAILNVQNQNKFSIFIIYNGVEKPLEVNVHEAVKAVLEHAIHLYGPIPNPHTLSLFTVAGQELDDNKSVQSAGIKPGDKLLLRPSQVKGG